MRRRQPWWQRIPLIWRFVPRPVPKVPVTLAEKRDKRLKVEGFLRWERANMLRYGLSKPFMKLVRRERRALAKRADREGWSDTTYYRVIHKFYFDHGWSGKKWGSVPADVMVEWMLKFYFQLAVEKGLYPKRIPDEDYPWHEGVSVTTALKRRYKGNVSEQKRRYRERQREARGAELSPADRARQERKWRGPARLNEATRRFE